MLITYFRSSSYNTWDYCEQKYFLTYVLGYQDSTNKKTELGTMCHKVLEVLAGLKQGYQNDGRYYYLDDALGEVTFTHDELYNEVELSDDEVDTVNKSRIDKNIYLWNVKIKYGHKRAGSVAVETLIRKSFEHYSAKSIHCFSNADFSTSRNFSWIALEHQNRAYDPRFRTIHAPESKFDIEIKRPWAKYKYLVGDQTLEGNLFIKGTIDLITEIDKDTLEVVDWKGLPLATPLPTPQGWTTMGEVQVGDLVFDKDGKQTKVIGKSKVKHKPCYKISFDDKTEVVCDDEHLWTLNDDKVVKVTDLKVRDKISVTKPLDITNIHLPIDPYVLGVWLGDGRNKNGEICGIDSFIFDEITKRGYKVGHDINSTSTCPSKTIYGLITELKKLNLYKNKHIPAIYLRASFQQRLDLLRGLMDSDGNANPVRKQAVFTNCNKTLSDDVKELLLTLGQRPNQATITKSGFGLIVQVYPIHFRPININPFLLPRKAEKIDPDWGSGTSHYRLIKKIELIENKYTQCIMVDSPSSTYLCTENMIPTHNTGQRKDWATGEIKSYEKLCNDDQLMLYYYAARQLFPKYKNIIFTIFFIRHGGPFTVCFDDKVLKDMEEKLRVRLKTIQQNKLPTMLDYTHQDFRCNRLCAFFKEKVDGQSLCSHIWKENKKLGMEKVVEKYKKPGFSLGHYSNPGE